MAIVDMDGDRLTPGQAAKLIVMDNANKSEFWDEQEFIIELQALTEGEKNKIGAAVNKQLTRVAKLLGLS